MRRAAKRDLNEPELVKAARAMGCIWFYAPPLDGWVYHVSRGSWLPIECKRPELEGTKNEFTYAETEFFRKCAITGAPFAIWRTVDDVVATIKGHIE